MKHLLFFLALIPAVLFSQTVDFSLTDETNNGISLSEVKFVVDGDGSYTLRYAEALAKAEVSGHLVDFYNANKSQFGLFISSGDTILVNKDFVSRVYASGSGSVLITNRFRYVFPVTASYSSAIDELSSEERWGTSVISATDSVNVSFPAVRDTSYQVFFTIEESSGSPSATELTPYVKAGKTATGFTVKLSESLDGGEVVYVHWRIKND